MKTTRIPLLAGAVMLALASTAAFAGPASGDVSGIVESRIIRFIVGIEPLQTLIEVDYVVTGTLPFTARLGGRLNDKTQVAVLDGYVSVGPAWLDGARVHDEFLAYTRADGTPCAKGTLYITPRWKPSQGNHDD